MKYKSKTLQEQGRKNNRSLEREREREPRVVIITALWAGNQWCFEVSS